MSKEITIKINKKHIWISMLLGIYCAIGASFSLTRVVTVENSPELDLMDETMVFVRTLYRSVSGKRLVTYVFAFAIGLLVYMGLQLYRTHKERLLLLMYALLFATGQMIAMSYKRLSSWDLLCETELQRFRSGFKWSAYVIICYFLVAVLWEAVKRFLEQGALGSSKPIASPAFSTKRFLLMAGLMYLAWIPYFIYFYPGTSNEDTVIQMMEYYEIPSYIQKMSPIQGDDIFITNHHPYLLTMLFAQFFKLGLNFGDISLGVAVYSLLHMAFLALVFSGCIQYIIYAGVSKKRIIGIQLIFMFFPIFPLYSICMVKDTIYAAFCLIFIMMMYHIAKTKGNALAKPGFVAALFALSCLMILTKVFALHILLIVGVVYLFKYRQYFKQIIVSIVVPAVLYKTLFCGVLLPALQVAPGGIQEALSVPFQQTARYVSEYGYEVTEEEKKAINAVLPYKKLAKLYNPELSDPVKKRYKQDATSEDLKRYFNAWFQMFLKHPEVYVESVLNNTYQYYDINKISSLEYYKFNDYLIRHDKNGEYTQLYVVQDEEYAQERYLINQLVLLLQKIPILNLFTSLGFIPWIILFAFLYNIKWKKKTAQSLVLIPLLTLLVCMVSPDNGNSRYIMPMLYEFPFLFALELLPE